MSQLTSSQINILRSRPQSTQLFLSFYQPKTIFQAQVTGTYNQGDNQIFFYGITTGSWWQIYPNMTAHIGSTPGGSELGNLRIRSASGTFIQFAENEVIWTQGLYITAIDQISIEAVYPRIIQNPNQQTDVIFYKDYDISYTNQNTIYGTFPCAGPHRAGFIVTGAWSTYYTSTGTYNVKGDSLTYSWAFEGGTPTGSTAKDPGFVRYTVPGHYKTRLIVTSSSGAQDTTYRYVSAYQKPNQGTFNPIEAWELEELSGSRGEGGYTARIKIMSIMPELQPHTLVVIWAEDSYGGNQVSLGSNSPNQESIVFNGYILQDSIKFNYEQSTMEFDVGSITELMKEAEGFSVSCESKASATTWYELTEMTIQKALYHYLRWHSTVLNVTDFQYTNDDRFLQYFDSDRESLFDAIDNFMRNGLLGAVVADRQGKLWAEISHFGLQTPFTTIPTNPLILNKQDWMGDPTIQERRDSDTSFVELGGIAYYGVTSNTFSALISNAPGTTPLYHGKSERQEGLILLSQQQLNQVAANYLAYKNTPFPEIVLPINGNYRNIDIAPQEQFYLVIAPSDTIRNVSLQGQPYTPTSMSWTYSSVHQSFIPSLTLEQMATGTMAETVLIPVTPPYANSGFDYPSLQLPTLLVFNPSDAVGPASPTNVLLHFGVGSTNLGLWYTLNFDAVSPEWLQMNGGLTATQYGAMNTAIICPNGAIYVARCKYDNDGFVARSPGFGQPFVIVEDDASIKAKYGAVTTGVWGLACDPSSAERVAYIVGTNDANNIYIGAGISFAQGIAINASNSGIGDGISQDFVKLSFGNNTWTLTCRTNAGGLHENAWVIASGGGSIISQKNLTTFGQGTSHMRAGNTSIVYTVDSTGGGSKYYRSADNFTTLTLIDVLTNIAAAEAGASIDGVGTQIMNRFDPGDKGKSNDGGFSYSFLPNLPPGTTYFWEYAGGAGSSSKWIAARSIIRFSQNFGEAWYNKEGNLTGQIFAVDLIRTIPVG